MRILSLSAGRGRVLLVGEGGHESPWLPGSRILRPSDHPPRPSGSSRDCGHGSWQQLLEVRRPSAITNTDRPGCRGVPREYPFSACLSNRTLLFKQKPSGYTIPQFFLAARCGHVTGHATTATCEFQEATQGDEILFFLPLPPPSAWKADK